MIAILSENPARATDIARIVGATEEHDGYMSGNGYMVTWVSGRPVWLAPLRSYGYSRLPAEDLPFIPTPFRLAIRQVKTAKGTTTDERAAVNRLNIIDRIFSQCQSIIMATDSGPEGELAGRYIYALLGYTKPFKRLWLSSLTDEAIEKGLADLKDGSLFDGLYAAADCRTKADWLIEVNTTSAMDSSSGMGNYPLDRLQTPVLAMICSRYHENRNFISTDYLQLHLTLEKDGLFSRFRYAEDLTDKVEAEKLFTRLKICPGARITKVEREKACQGQPLLYDLAALQIDCNVRLSLPAGKTLEIAQGLFEKKLVSYPGTSSRYIPEDVFREIPSLLRMILRMDRFSHFTPGINPNRPARKSVDGRRIAGHHALIITGDYPRELSEMESEVYHMIAGRMLEAFAPACEKEAVLTEAIFDGLLFRSRFQKVLLPGWRNVFNHSEDKEDDEMGADESRAVFEEGESAKLSGHSLVRKKTMPKPLYTEATLLAAMEMPGLGTPAMRAAIIAALGKKEYIEHPAKALVPTGKGLFIYEVVKGLRVADAKIAGYVEKMLSKVESLAMSPDAFMNKMEAYTRRMTTEVLSLEFPGLPSGTISCPKCGRGKVTIGQRQAKCGNGNCGLSVSRKFLNKELTGRQTHQLLSSGSTGLIKGFKSGNGAAFDAELVFDGNCDITLSFPKTATKGGKKAKPKPPSRKGRQKKNKK